MKLSTSLSSYINLTKKQPKLVVKKETQVLAYSNNNNTSICDYDTLMEARNKITANT